MVGNRFNSNGKTSRRILQTIESNITVTIIGCSVNGTREASCADIGIAGGIKEDLLFKK